MAAQVDLFTRVLGIHVEREEIAMRVALNVTEIGALFRQDPTIGDDRGFQSLLRSLQIRINGVTGEMDLTSDEVEKISHYAFDCGNSRWEARLVGIFGRSLGPSLGRDVVSNV